MSGPYFLRIDVYEYRNKSTTTYVNFRTVTSCIYNAVLFNSCCFLRHVVAHLNECQDLFFHCQSSILNISSETT